MRSEADEHAGDSRHTIATGSRAARGAGSDATHETAVERCRDERATST